LLLLVRSSCVNEFITARANALMCNIDLFLENLFQLANDTDLHVRKHVCRALLMLVEVRIERITPHMQQIIEYMLFTSQDGDETIALEACEFWLMLGNQPMCREVLQPYLDRLLPILVKNMKYSEIDVILLQGDAGENENVPDRPEDVHPRFHRGPVRQHTHNAQDAEYATSQSHDNTDTNNNSTVVMSTNSQSNQPIDDDDDDDDDDGGTGRSCSSTIRSRAMRMRRTFTLFLVSRSDSNAEQLTEWNLRKCSAAALDVLSNVFRESILPTLLSLLPEMLFHADWQIRESGILVLGAIAEGCSHGLATHLFDLVDYLIKCLKDEIPLVRSITCWTLSRYSTWIVHNEVAQQRFLHALMFELLARILDANKKVELHANNADESRPSFVFRFKKRHAAHSQYWKKKLPFR
jgi:transportin-1